jgi:hypothetical protein
MMNYETDKSESTEKGKGPEIVKVNEDLSKEINSKTSYTFNTKTNNDFILNSDSNTECLQVNECDDSEKNLYLFKADNCFCFKNTNLTNNTYGTNVSNKLKCENLPKQSLSSLTSSIKEIENDNLKKVEKNLSLNLTQNENPENEKDLEKLKKLRNIFASSYSTSSSSSSSSSSILNLVNSDPNQKLIDRKTNLLKSNNSLHLPSNELQSISEFFNPTTSSLSSSTLNSNNACEFNSKSSQKPSESIKKTSPNDTEKPLTKANNVNLKTKRRSKKANSLKTIKTFDEDELKIKSSTININNEFKSSMEDSEPKNANQTHQERVIIQFFYTEYTN